MPQEGAFASKDLSIYGDTTYRIIDLQNKLGLRVKFNGKFYAIVELSSSYQTKVSSRSYKMIYDFVADYCQ